MAFSTGTINSTTPAKDLAAAAAAQLTAGGYTFVETYATPTPTNWYQVAYGGGQFMTLGYNTATAATSPDGATWTQRALPVSQNWFALAYGAGTWVALANSSATYATSTDNGVTWVQRSMPAAGSWVRNLCFANGLFVTQTANTAYTSPDGINWTARTLPTNQNWQSSAYGNGVFVALGGGATMVRSADGITWTAHGMPQTVSWAGVTYGNGVFVAVATSGGIAATSPDGMNWTQRALPVTSSYWQGVTYGAGQFVAVTGSGVSYTATSPDGITWTQRTAAMPSTAAWSSIAYGGGQFAATAGPAITAASSPDGLTWTQRNMPGLSTSPVADVWKSPAAGNSFGSDWYLILRRAADSAAALGYQVAETYDPVAHKASNVGGTAQNVTPNPTTYSNPVGAVLADNGFGGSLALATGTAFGYWVSATPDRFILAVKVTTEQGFYAGLYEDLLPAGVTQFPLACAGFPSTVTVTGAIASGAAGFTGGFTREPGTSAASAVNFEAAIHNGFTKNTGGAGSAFASNFTPMTTSAALYGNVGALSRVQIGSMRAATNTADAVRGLLYGCLASAVTSLAGDTITSGGKTYVRFAGPTTTYGFFVDQAL